MENLAHESGGHRVQRVPQGERKGRVHSSTATVAVLDANPDLPLPHARRNKEDFAVSFFSGTGPGGQNRNKVQASARVVHLPTGVVRTAQTRSRENSVRLAMAAIEQELDLQAQAQLQALIQQDRAGQVGTGERADKRRTYRFQDDRVVDHMTGRSTRVKDAMGGHIDRLWPAR